MTLPWSVSAANTIHATTLPDDPGFCCHNENPGAQGVGTTWFKFVAEDPSDPTARTVSVGVSTCGSSAHTIDAIHYPADDSLIQVFSVARPDEGLCDDFSPCSIAQQNCVDGSICRLTDEIACRQLLPIGCNDNFNNCPLAEWPAESPQTANSEVCMPDLVVGETYYVMVAAKTEENRGLYRVTLRSPCTHHAWPPIPNDLCQDATPLTGTGLSIPFDLSGDRTHAPATYDCPAPECAPSMLNEIWYDWVAPATGKALVDTCLGPRTPHTYMVIYPSCDCPVDPLAEVCPEWEVALDCMGGTRAYFNVAKDTCYKIRLGGYNGRTDLAGDLHVNMIKQCPNDVVDFLMPPSGTADAGQPHPTTNPGNTQGFQSFLVSAPEFADMCEAVQPPIHPTCWSLCETAQDASWTPNRVNDVVNNHDGTYTVELHRPITPGAVTSLIFHHGNGSTTIGRFTSHPGNVDAGPMADANDIAALTAYLSDPNRGACADRSPCSLAAPSCTDGSTCTRPLHAIDIDRSGTATPTDLLRLIDLLRGAHAFTPWQNTPLPDCGDCCLP